MKTNNQTNSKKETKKHLIEAVIAYVAFCGLSISSRFVPPIFLLVVASGIFFPLVWAKLTRDWASIGFAQRNLGQALLWGLGAGLVSIVYIVFVFPGRLKALPPMLGLQMAIGIPVWFFIMSPFQEFFFRGWLQPRFQGVMRKWTGLFVTSLCFTLWHFCPPLEGTATSTLPITSVIGILSTFGFGMLFGYIFQRTDNIVAPWLAHALAGIALVLIGTMSFIQYTP